MSDERDGFDLAEDFNLISRSVDGGIYKAIQYQEYGYDHLWEDAIEELRTIRAMVNETLEHHQSVEEG